MLSNRLHNNGGWREENKTLREYRIMKSMRLQERYYLPFRHFLKLRRGFEEWKEQKRQLNMK